MEANDAKESNVADTETQELVPAGAVAADDVDDLTDPHFPVALRGYDREAVDAYVAAVGRELERLGAEPPSPQEAVREALEQVGEETAGILQRAHATADEVTIRARAEADDEVEEGRRRAASMVSEAERHLHDLDADTDLVWQERARIIEDTRALARHLEETAAAATQRFPAQERPAEQPAAFAAPEGGPTPDGAELPLGTSSSHGGRPRPHAQASALEDPLPPDGPAGEGHPLPDDPPGEGPPR